MIYLCSALYEEGEPFIRQLNLKKDLNITKFQVFRNDTICLIITGCGKIKASIAITYLFTLIKPASNSVLINIGCCGSKGALLPGSLFLINKIKDNDTSFTYYPDIIFKNPFKESSLETFSNIVTDKSKLSERLADLEASGVIQAASYFLEPEEIFFLKIVSDDLSIKNLKGSNITSLITKNIEQIINWINFIKENYKSNTDILNNKDIILYENICTNLRLSASMKNELKNILTFKKLENNNAINILLDYKNIICNSKKEGKKYLEEIKQRFI